MFFTDDYTNKFGLKPTLDLDQINNILVSNAQYVSGKVNTYTSSVNTFELSLFIGENVFSALLLLMLIIYCCSLTKMTPGSSICTATTSFFILIGLSLVFAFVNFRLLYLLDVCE